MSETRRRLYSVVALFVLSAIGTLRADVPPVLTHQGRITVNGANFHGTGSFKFALVQDAGLGGEATVWDTGTTALAIPVNQGHYSVLLGQSQALTADLFEDNDNLSLRIQFAADGTNFETLSPDRPITSSPYAFVAGTVPDGAITAEKLNLGGNAGEFLASTGTGVEWKSLSPATVFTRWGAATAPAGASMIYSGFAYSDYFGHSGRGEPIVIPPHTPDSGSPGTESLLYPVIVHGNPVPTGFTADTYLKAAVCLAPGPTTTIYGTWDPPTGWSVLYKGYAFGAHYTHEGGFAPLVIDSDSFDAGSDANGSIGSYLYPSRIQAAAPDGNTTSKFLRAAVIVKDP